MLRLASQKKNMGRTAGRIIAQGRATQPLLCVPVRLRSKRTKVFVIDCIKVRCREEKKKKSLDERSPEVLIAE